MRDPTKQSMKTTIRVNQGDGTMKLHKFFLIALLVGTFAVIGCGDNNSVTDQANDLCNRELCQTQPALKERCVDIVAACLDEPAANRDECAILAGETCDGG